MRGYGLWEVWVKRGSTVDRHVEGHISCKFCNFFEANRSRNEVATSLPSLKSTAWISMSQCDIWLPDMALARVWSDQNPWHCASPCDRTFHLFILKLCEDVTHSFLLWFPSKKIAKFTGDVPLHAYLVKPCLKPANPQADPPHHLSQKEMDRGRNG